MFSFMWINFWKDKKEGRYWVTQIVNPTTLFGKWKGRTDKEEFIKPLSFFSLNYQVINYNIKVLKKNKNFSFCFSANKQSSNASPKINPTD